MKNIGEEHLRTYSWKFMLLEIMFFLFFGKLNILKTVKPV